jgi:hypothetical protein
MSAPLLGCIDLPIEVLSVSREALRSNTSPPGETSA